MEDDKVRKKLPIKAGLFELPSKGKEGFLVGTKCKRCNEYFYPKRFVCANCYSEDLEETCLSKRGRIYSYTIARMGYPGRPINPPFITAQVELPEKVHILTLITDIDLHKVKIGIEVELCFWRANEDNEGDEMWAFAFRPVEPEEHKGGR